MAVRFDLPSNPQFDAESDAPADGGLLYFYVTGTSTPLDTYSNDGLTSANVNPVVCDSAGRHGDVFLQARDYKVILKTSAGVTIKTMDPVHGGFTLQGTGMTGLTNIAAMTVLLKAGLSDSVQVVVSGYATAGDGGGGTFYWHSGSSTTADGGTVFAADEGGTGRWKRIFSGPVSPKWFGAKGDGVTGDTTALQAALDHAAKWVIVPVGTYIFTTLTIPVGVRIVGVSQDTSIWQTTGTGNAVTINGHYVQIENLKIAKSGGQAGKGIVADDKYWLTTKRLWVDGFDYDTYFSKSIYHSHYDSRFTDSNYALHYYGASGSWNVDWYNNQIVLSNVIAHGDTVGCYIKGVGVTLDVDAVGTTAIQITGENSTFPAQAIAIVKLYSENADTVLDLDYAHVDLTTAFVSGGPNSGARANTPFDLSNSSLIIGGKISGQNYWDYTYVLTNSSRLESSQQIASGADFTTTSKDATSEAYINDYEEGSFTGTLTGCTTSPTGTIKYTRDGDQVSLYVLTDIQGTSNTTAATITGIPAAIQPSTTQRFNCMVKDNTANVAGYAAVAAGTMTLFTTVAFGSTSFTGSGTKGLIGEQVLTYTRK